MIDVDSIIHIEKENVIFSCGLILPIEQEDSCIQLAQQIDAQKNSSFVLNKQTYPPYVRLYEVILPLKNVATAYERMTTISEQMLCFETHWGEVEQNQHFVAIWLESNEVLEAFHAAVLEAINPLREGEYKYKYATHDMQLTPTEERGIQMFGSPWALSYIPHVVIAKAKTLFTLPFEDINWEYTVCEFGATIMGIKNEDGIFSDFKINSFSS